MIATLQTLLVGGGVSNITNSASGVYNITNSASGGGVVATLQTLLVGGGW